MESYDQVDLWENPIVNIDSYYVYHDESIPNKQWLIIGLVFVGENDLDTVKKRLKDIRRKEQNYKGEVHFSKLPDSFEGPYGVKARVAYEWMKLFQKELYKKVHFSALAVDRYSSKYDYNRFTKDFHAYNRFTAMALKAGISWLLDGKRFDELKIKFISDAKDRRSSPSRDEKFCDNFEDYIPFRAELDAYLAQLEGKSYPKVTLCLEPKNSAKEDLLQLCDVFLGAIQCAIVGASRRETKRKLADIVINWHEDLQRPIEEQKLGLYKKFNLWAFPNQDGRPYTNIKFNLIREMDVGNSLRI